MMMLRSLIYANSPSNWGNRNKISKYLVSKLGIFMNSSMYNALDSDEGPGEDCSEKEKMTFFSSAGETETSAMYGNVSGKTSDQFNFNKSRVKSRVLSGGNWCTSWSSCWTHSRASCRMSSSSSSSFCCLKISICFVLSSRWEISRE